MGLVVGIGWLILMFYIMLFCQHRICEAYFVPALNVLMDSMGSSSNPWLQRLGNPGVAGATFMALGANGPELFTNLFALFAGSDGGIGVVIGSEIFNILIIIGASIISTKSLPLQLEKVPFVRDVLFYSFSIVLLLWAIKDHKVVMYEANVMLAAGALYWICVYFTDDVAIKIGAVAPAGDVEQSAAGASTKVHGVHVEVEEVFHSRMADGHGHASHAMQMSAESAGIAAVDDEPVSKKKGSKRGSVGFAVGGNDPLLGDNFMRYKDLDEVAVMSEGVIHMTFEKNAMERVTLKVKVTGGANERETLLKNLQENSLAEGRTWFHNYDPTVMQAIGHLKHHLKHEGALGKLHAIGEFFVDFVLSLTMFWCDVKDITKEGRWPLCFCMSMIWLAFFSFAMVQVMNQITANIPALSAMLLGVTIGAIGTSLPNAIGSVIMAQQGKSAAAIGNAFGSNVQNVFLAMAGPWIIYLSTTGADAVGMAPPKKGQSVGEGVLWMVGTLALVVVFAILPPFMSFNRTAGYIFVAVYIGYLVWTVCEFEFF
eukprot:TRINITY_DN2886_c2_g1_i1.p1 TRINITY_DN2886_c2_g1~~TRINITY_DN2886_c2_g1_i1.p1  ORF type:complete len:541 (+),score=125.53 TRINITY_DN2886_c2_g1_i1:476-2098(+)